MNPGHISVEQLFTKWIETYGWNPILAKAVAYTASVATLLVVALVLGIIVNIVLGGFIRHVASKTETKWDDYILDHKFFTKLSYVAPSIFSLFFLHTLFPTTWMLFAILHKILLILIALSSISLINQLLTNFEIGFREINGDKKLPIKGYIQIVRILLALVALILLVSIITDQQPWGILSGLGAMTAILMLVFKDTITGFMASIQMNSNNLVKIGDWIEIPGQNIDGEVVDITLHVVKIKSADNTLYSIPTTTLVAGSLKNWRPVAENKSRRLKGAFPIDAGTIVLGSEEFKQQLTKQNLWALDSDPAKLTNLDAFRAYVEKTLQNEPDVLKTPYFVVKIGVPTGRGVPVEILYYTNVVAYPAWEGLNSRIMSHFLAVLPAFGLKLFQEGTPSRS